jgi:hypothetical protein
MKLAGKHCRGWRYVLSGLQSPSSLFVHAAHIPNVLLDRVFRRYLAFAISLVLGIL